MYIIYVYTWLDIYTLFLSPALDLYLSFFFFFSLLNPWFYILHIAPRGPLKIPTKACKGGGVREGEAIVQLCEEGWEL